MLTRDQKAYLNHYMEFIVSADADHSSRMMDKMDRLYGRFSWTEMDTVEEWIDRYHRGEDTEDISGLGYDA